MEDFIKIQLDMASSEIFMLSCPDGLAWSITESDGCPHKVPKTKF